MHSKIANAILDGIYNAHRIQWIRAGSAHFCPAESVYLCQIADAIDNAGYQYIKYEYKVSKLIQKLGISPGQNITASNGKIDLLISINKNEPLAIVEIKAEYAQASALEKDLFRICDLLQNRSREKFPMLFGVFAVGLVRYRETDIKQHIKDSFESMQRFVKQKTNEKELRCSPYPRDFVDSGNIVWGATCFIIHD